MADHDERNLALSMEHITKVYSNGFIANKDVTLQVSEGEIMGLLGENGAGKTTLMKVLFGLETPEEGTIKLYGQQVHITSSAEALNFGIGMVHQHFMLVDELSVTENIILGDIPTKNRILYDTKKAREMVVEVSEKYHLPIDPDAIIADLSVGMKQRVEILKMLIRGAKILLFDEPTAVLTPQETKELFVQLKRLKKEGFTIVFISHKLNEIKEICDRITVLRKGRLITACDISDLSVKDISALMVGRDVSLSVEKEKATPGKPIVKVRNLEYTNPLGVKIVNGVSFSVREGEIFGIAGVEGNGQTELSDIMMGLLPIQMGEVLYKDKQYQHMKMSELRSNHIAFVHEDRMAYGTSANQKIYENLISDRIDKRPFSKNGIMNMNYIKGYSTGLIKDFTIACDGYNAAVSTLSGGNIQKVVAAREFSSNADILVISQPTRGIDVGATEVIKKKIVSQRDDNHAAIVLLSADLDELLMLSDRLIVMYDGKIVAYFDNLNDVDENILGEYMLGLKVQPADRIGGAYIE